MESLRVMAIGLIGGFLGGMLSSKLATVRPVQAESSSVRAQRFELVDEAGKLISAWGRYDSDDALIFFDEQGRQRAEFGFSRSSQTHMLIFRGADARLRVTLTSDLRGKSALNLGDEERESRVLLGYIGDDSPSPNSDAWGLLLPKNGALSDWMSIGVSKDPVTGVQSARISALDRNGNRWHAPR